MSVSKTIYIGQYVRAKLPPIMITIINRACDNAHVSNDPTAVYCKLCGHEIGTKTEILKEPGKVYEFCYLVFNNEGVFYEPNDFVDPDGWSYFLSNLNSSRQGGNCTIDGKWGDARVSELPERVGLIGDWAVLCVYLSEHKIPYELKYGIIEYWS